MGGSTGWWTDGSAGRLVCVRVGYAAGGYILSANLKIVMPAYLWVCLRKAEGRFCIVGA